MIKSEAHLKQESIRTGLFGIAVFSILGLFTKNINFPIGFLLGSVIALVILNIDCQSAKLMLEFRLAKPSFLQGFVFFIKLGIYALGFLCAVMVPGLINIYCVAIGYLTVKLTIFRLAMKRR